MPAPRIPAGYWRQRAAPVIRGVLEDMKGKPEKEIRAALREAYPFGERRYHPYKVWLDEIRVQRKKKAPTGVRGAARERAEADDPNQGKLFPASDTTSKE
jgi:hypothetical protein